MKRLLRSVASRLAIAVVAVAGFFWLGSGLEDPVQAHLDAVKAGDLHGAYEQTAPQFRQVISFEQYEAFIQRHPSLSGMDYYEIGSWGIESPDATVEATATDAAGTAVSLVFTLVEENDAWHIVGVALGDRTDAPTR